MKGSTRVSTVIAAALTSVAAALAPAGTHDLSWHTVDGGGGVAAAGDLVLAGTIGQPDVGASGAGDLVLTGGFWAATSGAPRCPGDIDDNGVVDVADLVVLLSAWGVCPGCPEDLDGNGVVDVADLVTLLAAWGPCPG